MTPFQYTFSVTAGYDRPAGVVPRLQKVKSLLWNITSAAYGAD